MFNIPTWKLYICFLLTIGLIFLATKAFNFWNEYQALKIEKQKLIQNSKALEDSINIQAAKITEITSFVRNLNDDNSKLKKENIALQIKNKSLIDSIRILNRDTIATVTDSTVRVDFGGKEKIVNFSGWTFTNLKTLKSKWSLFMNFDPIETTHELFEENNIWKVRSISLTEGVIVKGISIINEETYNRLQKYKPSVPANLFGVNFLASQDELFSGISLNISSWIINIDYKLTNQSKTVLDNILIGVHCFIF